MQNIIGQPSFPLKGSWHKKELTYSYIQRYIVNFCKNRSILSHESASVIDFTQIPLLGVKIMCLPTLKKRL